MNNNLLLALLMNKVQQTVSSLTLGLNSTTAIFSGAATGLSGGTMTIFNENLLPNIVSISDTEFLITFVYYKTSPSTTTGLYINKGTIVSKDSITYGTPVLIKEYASEKINQLNRAAINYKDGNIKVIFDEDISGVNINYVTGTLSGSTITLNAVSDIVYSTKPSYSAISGGNTLIDAGNNKYIYTSNRGVILLLTIPNGSTGNITHTSSTSYPYGVNQTSPSVNFSKDNDGNILLILLRLQTGISGSSPLSISYRYYNNSTSTLGSIGTVNGTILDGGNLLWYVTQDNPDPLTRTGNYFGHVNFYRDTGNKIIISYDVGNIDSGYYPAVPQLSKTRIISANWSVSGTTLTFSNITTIYETPGASHRTSTVSGSSDSPAGKNWTNGYIGIKGNKIGNSIFINRLYNSTANSTYSGSGGTDDLNISLFNLSTGTFIPNVKVDENGVVIGSYLLGFSKLHKLNFS